MAVQFKPKPGKPHIRMAIGKTIAHLWVICAGKENRTDTNQAKEYCLRVNPGVYSSSGDAARALHYGSANK